MKKSFIVAGIVAVIMLVAGGYLSTRQKFGGSSTYNFLGGTVSTSGSVTLGADATTVLSQNSARKYAYICNDSSNVTYLHFGPTSTAAINSGIRLNAVSNSGSCYEIKSDNLYTGIISATGTASSILTVIED